jgi:hypothetical protein
MKEAEFLLGNIFSLLTQCRQHIIKIEDTDGLELIEDQYQMINEEIKNYYRNKDAGNGT